MERLFLIPAMKYFPHSTSLCSTFLSPDQAFSKMISAAFSAIIIVGAPVCPPGILGITDESATRSPIKVDVDVGYCQHFHMTSQYTQKVEDYDEMLCLRLV